MVENLKTIKEIQDASPSVLHSSSPISFGDELEERQKRASSIQKLGVLLHLPQSVIATAIYIMQRFHLKYAIQENSIEDVTMTCFFLAAKIEETPKKLKEIMMIYYRNIKNDTNITPDKEEFIKVHDRILQLETCALKSIKFELIIEHPYPIAINFCKILETPKLVAQTVWCVISDSYLNTLFCLQYEPLHVAWAALMLTNQVVDFELFARMKDVPHMYEYLKSNETFLRSN
ncbi:cyclin-like protein [Rozella allomycis CSF55]|uniref:Cyclin-like protein n=1 Tax=Rozella allomycis (strain CSF55) TaxID=988480 RepID=A0A4P9YH91_ROZAC|nr:cyclin-like protein [Rozella allomycis CSF55]